MSDHKCECISAWIDDCFRLGYCQCECGKTWPPDKTLKTPGIQHTPTARERTIRAALSSAKKDSR